jgi:3-isopropylmalate dehydrogenase
MINPLAAILAGAMMLEFLDQQAAADSIEIAVQKALINNVRSLDAGKMGMGTKELGDLIVQNIVDQ